MMAVSGHTTRGQVQRQIEAFGRQNVADAAMGRLQGERRQNRR
jgi:hypothetical protein